jgi:hypothetical protein
MRKAKLKTPRCRCDTSLIYFDAPGSAGISGGADVSGFSVTAHMFVHVRDESDVSISGLAIYNVQLDVDYAGKVLVAKP